jgi:signal transduction histidine kinase
MKKAQVIWSVFVIAVTAAIVFLVWSHLKSYLANDHQVVLAREAQWRLHELAIQLQAVENGVRGYLLTSRQQFLDNFRAARQRMDERVEAAEKAVPGVQLDSDFGVVRALVVERLSLLDRMIERAGAGAKQEAVALLDSEPVLANGSAIRELGFELLRKTDERLVQRLDRCRASTVTMTRWVLIGVAALTLSSTALVWLLWRDLRRQCRINAELGGARDAALAGTKARDEFLNVLSHELRTPLTPALACIGLLERKTPANSEIREDLTLVRRQLELEARLIDDLLNVEQTLHGKMVLRMRDVSVHELIKQGIDSCQEQIVHGHLTLHRQLDATRDVVRGDESRLYLVLWHVLSNAIKFTPAGGSISVRSENSGDSIVVIISDTGIGIHESQLATLFEPFKQVDSSLTRRFGGLGLGLAISKHVAKLHGGSIRAHSDGEGRGATFTLTLPLVVVQPSQDAIERRGEPLSDLR